MVSLSFGNTNTFKSLDNLREKLFDAHPTLSNYDIVPESNLSTIKFEESAKHDIKINIDTINYYQTNIVARNSETMKQCKESKNKIQKTGTDN